MSHLDYKRDIVKTSLPVPECHLEECHEDSVYEGYARFDPWMTTQRSIFVSVCEEHKTFLTGFRNEASSAVDIVKEEIIREQAEWHGEYAVPVSMAFDALEARIVKRIEKECVTDVPS